MKPIVKIKVGSNVFFNKFSDFESKDVDWFVVNDTFFKNKDTLRIKIGNDDIIMFRDGLSKQDHINMVLNSNVPIKVGKFLVPEFNNYIGFTILELPIFENIINLLDDIHKYEKVIYDSYIKNNSFTLTDEQLNEAYNEYKKYRK